MNLKKLAGFLLAALTLCSSSTTISKADTTRTDIEVKSDVTGLQIDVNDHALTIDADDMSNVNVTQDLTGSELGFYLFSTTGNKYSTTGGTINFSAPTGSSLNIYDINLGNQINAISGTKLNISGNTTLSSITGSADTYINGGTVQIGNILSSGLVNVAGGTLTATNIGLTSSKIGSYTQSGGDVTVDNIYSTGNVELTGGTLSVSENLNSGNKVNLSGNSNIKLSEGASLSANSDISLSENSGINVGMYTITKGNVSTSGKYIQNTSKDIHFNELYADNGVEIKTGSLYITSIGSSSKGVGSYTQGIESATTNEDIRVEVDALYSLGDVTVYGGVLDVLNNIGSESRRINNLVLDSEIYESLGGLTEYNIVSKNIYSANNIEIRSGILGAQKIDAQKDIKLNAGKINTATLNALGSYIQSGGSLYLKDYYDEDVTPLLTAKNINISNNSVVMLYDNAKMMTTSGNIVVDDSSDIFLYEKGSSLVSSNDINVSNGSRIIFYDKNTEVKSSSGNIDISNSEIYMQAEGAKMSSVNGGISISGSAVGMLDDTMISTTGTNSDISVTGNSQIATMSGAVSELAGTISSGASYKQNGSGTQVSINKLLAVKDVNISNGSLNTNTIGTSTDKVTAYNQTGGVVTTGNIYTIGNAELSAGSLTVNEGLSAGTNLQNAGGTLTVNADASAQNAFIQKNSAITNISDNKKISAASVSATGGTINLGNSSKLEATNGNIDVTNTTIKDDSKSAEISGSANYTQSGTSDVSVKNLSVTGDVKISSGSLTVTNLGSSSSKIGTYTQTGGNVTIENLYTIADSETYSGDVELSGGTLTLNKKADIGGNFTVKGVTTSFINNIADSSNFKIAGTFILEDGSTVVIDDNRTLSVTDYEINDGTTLELLKNASVVATNSFKVYGGTVTDSLDGGNKTGTINAGKLYSQSGGTVEVSKILADSASGSISINGGVLTTDNIGQTDSKVGSYNQTAGTVTSKGLYTTNDVSVSGGTLTSDNIVADGNYSQSNLANVQTKNLESKGNTRIQNSTLKVSQTLKSAGDINVSDNASLTIDGTLTSDKNMTVEKSNLTVNGSVQVEEFSLKDNGSVTVSAGNTITGKSILLSSSSVSLANNSKLIGSEATKGIYVIESSEINSATHTKTGSIETTGTYNQDTTGSVYIDKIIADKVFVFGGTLQANDIGSATQRISQFYQNGASTDTSVNQISASGDIIVEGGNLTVASQIGSVSKPITNYFQGDEVDTVSIGSGGMYLTGNIIVDAGSLYLNGDTTSSAGVYSQTNDSKVFVGNDVDISTAVAFTVEKNAQLSLGTNSTINSKDVVVSDSAIISKTGTNAVINATNVFTQNGAASKVTVNEIYAEGGVQETAGTLTASNIGSQIKKVKYYNQGSASTSPLVNVDNVYSLGSAVINNGTLNVASSLNSDADVTVVNGSVAIGEKLNAAALNQSGGVISVADNAIVSTKNNILLSSNAKMSLGANAQLNTTENSSTITVSGTAGINDASGLKQGKINTAGSYSQTGNTTVYADSITAKQNVSISGGNLTVNNIGSETNPIGGTYNQSEAGDTTTVNTNNIYANKIEISNGTLNIGIPSAESVLYANNFNITGGVLNLYNTTFKVPVSLESATSSFIANGVTMNFNGINALGQYDSTNYINSLAVGNSKIAILNILDNSTLSVAAGAGNYIFGANSKINVNENAILNLSAAEGNLAFDIASSIINKGNINILQGLDGKVVTLGNVNAKDNSNGQINVSGNTEILGNVFTDKYVQNGSSTTLKSNAVLESSNTGVGIELNAGALVFSGNNAKVNVENGTFQSANEGTEIKVASGKDNQISAKQISISDTNINVEKDSSLALNPGSGNLQITSGSTNLKENATLTINTENGSANIADSSISLDTKSNLNLQGNTTVSNTKINVGNSANLNLNSNKGNISINSDSAIENSGFINVDGDSNTVTISSGINYLGKNSGSIVKNGKNTLNLDGKVYGSSLTHRDGIVNANKDIYLLDNMVVEGDFSSGKTATLNIAEGVTVKSESAVILGSTTNNTNSIVNLSNNSVLIGSSVDINAVVNMVKATIEADLSKNGNVNIGSKANITVSHYDGDGDNISVSKISANQINISGGSNILIQDGAKLEYDGIVSSNDAHYDIEKGAEWVINSGTYSNTESVPAGAIVSNAGNVTIKSNVEFVNSTSQQHGGAVYNTGNILTDYNPAIGIYANNVAFTNNKAGYTSTGRLSSYADQNGGALYNGIAADGTNGIVKLGNNSSFTNNKASGKGGAIYNISSGSATENAITLFDNAIFKNNSSILGGGAIYAAGDGTVSIGKGAVFENNTTGYDLSGSLSRYSNGGAIYTENNAKIIIGNDAYFNANSASQNGGAIYNEGTIVIDGSKSTAKEIKISFMQNGVYNGNVNTEKGGAIYNAGSIITKDESGNEINGLYMAQFGNGSESEANRAKDGGAIYNAIAADQVFYINKSGFNKNIALGSGGAIYNEQGTIQIDEKSYIINNTAELLGGAIYNNSKLILTPGVKIGDYGQGNAADKGGAIYNNSLLSINATEEKHVSFIGNKAQTAGGAIYNNGKINDDSANKIEYADFIENTVGSNDENTGLGGAIYNAQGSLNIENSNFVRNTVSSTDAKGGAIYNAAGATVTIGEKASFSENKATGSNVSEKKYVKGGAIYNAGTLNVKAGAILQNNEATEGYGGAIYNADGAKTDIGTNVVIGGTMDEYYAETIATSGNSALKGGGIYNDNGILSFNDKAYFIGNNATEAGGGLYYKSSEDFATDKLEFYSNTSEGYGGGLYNDKDSTGTVSVKNTRFMGNTAKYGAAVYNAGTMYIEGNRNTIPGYQDVNQPAQLINPGSNYFEGNLNGSAIGNEGTLNLSNTFEFGYKEDAIKPNAGALYNIGQGVINASASYSKINEVYVYLPSLYLHHNGYIDEEGNAAVDGAGLYLGYKDDIGLATINTVDVVRRLSSTQEPTLTTYNDTLSSAFFEANIGYHGGALYKNTTKDLTIIQKHNCFTDIDSSSKVVTFYGNKAIAKNNGEDNDAAGGAIYNIGKNSDELSKIYIDSPVKFRNNYTSGKGGAIYNGENGVIEFASGYIMGDSTYGYSNTAAIAGGAIANEGLLNLKEDKETRRSIYFTYQGGANEGVYNGKGGALYLGEKGLIHTAIYDPDLDTYGVTSGISKAVFTNNESKYGGAIYFNTSLYVSNVDATQFSGNRGYIDGGAIYNEHGEINISLSENNDNIFVGNMAGNDIGGIASSGRGGAIFNKDLMHVKGSGKVFVSNNAIGTEGMGGAIYNQATIDITTDAKPLEFINNSAVYAGGAIATSGEVALNLFYEDMTGIHPSDIVFSQNIAPKGSAVYLAGGKMSVDSVIDEATGKTGTLTFVDEDKEKGIIAQTVAGNGIIEIKGGNVNFYSDASGFSGKYYQTGGTVTSKNKFLNIQDSDIRTVTGGTLVLDQGSQLMSDYLLVSNIEEDSSNSAKIIFNPNTKSKLTDLSALYENASTFNYFKYTNTDDNKEHKVSLRAADVEINDTAVIDKAATIGNAKNSYMVRNLSLSKGAKLDSNITVYGGNTVSDTGATFAMNEGAIGTEKSSITLKGYNSNLEFNNSKTDILIGGTIKNDGVAYNNTIKKTEAGTVIIKGDASGYNGAYEQTGGILEFAKGSKYFGAATTTNVTGGELKIANDVDFAPGTVINFNSTGMFAVAKQSSVDLTGASGSIITMADSSATVNLGQNAGLKILSNAEVNATKDVIRIGNNALQVNNVILGGSASEGGNVNIKTNPNTKFVLQNESNPVGQGGVLGFGENVTFKDTADNVVIPTIQLKDNTQLQFNNENNSDFTAVVQSIDDTENLQTAWANTNGQIVKDNKGLLTLKGAVGDFHGSLVVKDGQIATDGTAFANDVVYDLSKLSDDAKATVINTVQNNDMTIVGGVSPENSNSKYSVVVANDRGNISVKNAANTADGDIYVVNESNATIVANGKTTTGNVLVKDSSVLNVGNAESFDVSGNLTIKNSTINMQSGNMNIAGNYTMGSTFNMMNGTINTQNIAGNMTLTDNSNYLIDINPQLYQNDRVVISGNLQSDVAGTTRQLNIEDYNLITDPVAEYSIYKVFDVQGKTTDIEFTTSKPTLNTPIANYLFMPSGNSGSYLLARTGFTPTAMANPAAMQVGGFLSQVQTYDEALASVDSVMILPNAGYNSNYYVPGMDDAMVYSPMYIPELEKGLWFRPYGNFEKVNLQDGPEVSNQTFGALVGGDTALTELGRGFQGTLGGYIGYTGSHQSFDGISGNQNGGIVGLTGAVYNGGFFSGLTVNVDASGSSMNTPYGNSDFFMLSAGVASKTGYNWELGRGKFIIQPSWLMSYTFVNAFNPSNIANYNIDAKALHGVQLVPGVKFMANLPYGWQPYLQVDFRLNLGDKTHFTAGNIDLPETFVKSYIEYGLGMQKRWGDRFTGFGQFLARNGGRNGVGVNLGLRWSVGQGR